MRPTLAGGWFLAILLGVTLAALNTGNNLVYIVLAALMCLLVVNNVLAEWNLRGLRVGRRLPGELFAGTPSEGELVLSNWRRVGAAFAVEVEERDGGHARAVFDHVAAGAEGAVPASWTFPERGEQRFSVVRVGSCYPFGLLRRWRDVEVPDEVLVYPAADRQPPPTSAAADGPGLAVLGGVDDTGELQGIRGYEVGDPVRRIHWGISARVGSPMVVVRAGERGGEALVLVEPAPAGPAREAAIRRACGRVEWHFRHGDSVGLDVDGEIVPVSNGAAHRRKLLTRLALLPRAPEAAAQPRRRVS